MRITFQSVLKSPQSHLIWSNSLTRKVLQAIFFKTLRENGYEISHSEQIVSAKKKQVQKFLIILKQELDQQS